MKGEFECLRENTEKRKTFSVPIEEEVKDINKDGNESVVTTSSKIKIIDSAIFMVTSLSSLVDNPIDVIHKIKCKDCDCFGQYKSCQDNLTKHEYFPCNKDYLN